jgi:hypothetical protein
MYTVVNEIAKIEMLQLGSHRKEGIVSHSGFGEDIFPTDIGSVATYDGSDHMMGQRSELARYRYASVICVKAKVYNPAEDKRG